MYYWLTNTMELPRLTGKVGTRQCRGVVRLPMMVLALVIGLGSSNDNEGCNNNIDNNCENILCGYLYDGDLVFVILKGISIFKFPRRFLKISSRDLTSFLLWLILRPYYPIIGAHSLCICTAQCLPSSSKDLITDPLVPVPFAFAWLNAFQAAVTHSYNNDDGRFDGCSVR